MNPSQYEEEIRNLSAYLQGYGEAKDDSKMKKAAEWRRR